VCSVACSWNMSHDCCVHQTADKFIFAKHGMLVYMYGMLLW
jgi:hypothetical protein